VVIDNLESPARTARLDVLFTGYDSWTARSADGIHLTPWQ
jgi:hypothetical protein